MGKVASVFAYSLFGLSWLSFIVMLGGVAGMQAKCGGYLGHTIKIGPFEQFEDCDTTNTTAFVWWTVFFEFFVLLLLSIAECCRVPGLYLTKQIFLAMVSVCLMLAADRANVVASTFEGALKHSARAAMAGQVITIICNLVLLLYFGGEVQELRRPHPYGEAGAKEQMLTSSDMQAVQMAGLGASTQGAPSYASGPAANPFAV